MRVRELDLNGGPTAIGIGGKGSQRIDQPVDRRASQQIVLRAQCQILRDIGATGRVRAPLCFSQRQLPCLV